MFLETTSPGPRQQAMYAKCQVVAAGVQNSPDYGSVIPKTVRATVPPKTIARYFAKLVP